MRIQHVKIRNFRAVKEFDGDFGNITSFIGYNGSGKSSIIRAINWFFEGHRLNETDYFKNFSGEQNDEISVEIKFISLNESEKSQFKKYVKNDSMTIMRSQNIGEEKSKLFGSPNIIPEIEKIRSISGIKEQRDELKKLFENEEIFASSEDAQIINNKKATRAEFDDLLIRLEMYTGNSSKYETRKLEEATNFQGFSGGSEIRDAAGFIFLPAGEDITEEFDSNNRGSAMNVLIGTLLKDTLVSSIKSWQENNTKVLQELEDKIKNDSRQEINKKEELINYRLSMFLPGVKFKLDPSLDDWKPKPAAFARPTIDNGSQEFPIENQGHGVQRAALLALLQAITDDRVHDDSSIGSSSLVICIEEPEVYQHPQQARAIATSFENAASSDDANIQFIYATHSPYFVSFRNLESTYRVSSCKQGINVHSPKKTGIFQEEGNGLYKYYEKSLINGLFARLCLLVEGDTDAFILRNINTSSKISQKLENVGIEVVEVNGAGDLPKIAEIISSYNVPIHVMRDGDSNKDIARQQVLKRDSKKTINKYKSDVENKEKIFGRKLTQDEILAIPKIQAEIDQKVNNKICNWKNDVKTFVEKMGSISDTPESGHIGANLDKFKHGEFFHSECITILEHDLEFELSRWPSFSAILDTSSRNNKQAGEYLGALQQASYDDIPTALKTIIETVVNRLIITPSKSSPVSTPNHARNSVKRPAILRGSRGHVSRRFRENGLPQPRRGHLPAGLRLQEQKRRAVRSHGKY